MSKSKVAQAKEDQAYRKESPRCSNCQEFTSDTVGSYYTHDKNLRCSIGNFAVLKGGWCKKHKV